VCPGTFDPITNGHVDIVGRALDLFDHVIVAISANPDKSPLFTLEERIALAREALSGRSGVDVTSFDGLLVTFARQQQAHVVIKGLRAVSDFEREFQMAQLGHLLDEGVETLFMMASNEYQFLSSSAVKEIARYGGAVKDLVPANVDLALRERLAPAKGGA
jgi:pantetheine-phosphate adenylyltransferase